MNKDVLAQLATPFPQKFVHSNPSGGGSYIKHHVIEQRLIQVFGRPPNFEKVEVLFGDVDAIPPNPNGKSQRAKDGRPALKAVVVGVIARLSIEVDGQKWIAEEAGDCEEPHNWKTDGQRLKDAMSDAYKRCAMRWGCGLHLWSQDEYFLHQQLSQPGSESPSSKGPHPAHAPAENPVAGSEATPPEPDADGGAPQTASPPSSPAGGDAEESRDNGEVVAGSDADPSSGDLIRQAVKDKRVFLGQVLTAANNEGTERGLKIKLTSKTLYEQSPEFITAVAKRLNLLQGELV